MLRESSSRRLRGRRASAPERKNFYLTVVPRDPLRYVPVAYHGHQSGVSGYPQVSAESVLVMEANSAQTITRTRVFDVLKRYDSIISQVSKRDKSTSKNDSSAGGALQTLDQLDQWRLHELPETVEQRKKEHDGAWLTKEEVTHLTRWKL